MFLRQLFIGGRRSVNPALSEEPRKEEKAGDNVL